MRAEGTLPPGQAGVVGALPIPKRFSFPTEEGVGFGRRPLLL